MYIKTLTLTYNYLQYTLEELNLNCCESTLLTISISRSIQSLPIVETEFEIDAVASLLTYKLLRECLIRFISLE